MPTINIDKLRKHASVTFEAKPEHIPVEGNASGIDPETDAAIERNIEERLRAGSEWAWCMVACRAQYAGREGTDYLGCCSYMNKKDFLDNSGYADDMREAALEELASQLEADIEALLAVYDDIVRVS